MLESGLLRVVHWCSHAEIIRPTCPVRINPIEDLVYVSFAIFADPSH